MNRKSLVSEFNVRPQSNTLVKDYDVFQDKGLLLKLKDEVVANIVDYDYKDVINANVINEAIDKVIKDYDLNSLERNYLYHLVDNDINGYGPITEVINDRAVINIMVNSPSEIYIETKDGIVKDDSISFIDDEHIIKTINKLLKTSGKVISRDNPVISAKVINGALLEALMPPVTNRPVLTLKKYNEDINTINELIRIGTLTPYMARFLEACVLAKLNILVTGLGNSGKSVLVNSLVNLIPQSNRVVLMEESNTLEVKRNNLIRINNKETNEAFDIVKKLLADNIIVDEINKDNAFLCLELMSSNKGIITLVDGRSPVDALTNIVNMIAIKNPYIRSDIISSYLKQSFDIIVNIRRINDNTRKVVSIVEVKKDKNLSLKEIFAFKNDGINFNKEIRGEFILYDFVPDSYKYIKQQGIDIIDDIFDDSV